jgi:hypothetical protein
MTIILMILLYLLLKILRSGLQRFQLLCLQLIQPITPQNFLQLILPLYQRQNQRKTLLRNLLRFLPLVLLISRLTAQVIDQRLGPLRFQRNFRRNFLLLSLRSVLLVYQLRVQQLLLPQLLLRP